MLDILSQVKLNEITYICRDGDNYYLGFEDVTEDKVKFAHNVYTGNVGMNGKINVSRVLKGIREVVKVSSTECKLGISKDSAQTYLNVLKAEGYELRFSNNVSKEFSEETGKPRAWVFYVVG